MALFTHVHHRNWRQITAQAVSATMLNEAHVQLLATHSIIILYRMTEILHV